MRFLILLFLTAFFMGCTTNPVLDEAFEDEFALKVIRTAPRVKTSAVTTDNGDVPNLRLKTRISRRTGGYVITGSVAWDVPGQLSGSVTARLEETNLVSGEVMLFPTQTMNVLYDKSLLVNPDFIADRFSSLPVNSYRNYKRCALLTWNLSGNGFLWSQSTPYRYCPGLPKADLESKISFNSLYPIVEGLTTDFKVAVNKFHNTTAINTQLKLFLTGNAEFTSLPFASPDARCQLSVKTAVCSLNNVFAAIEPIQITVRHFDARSVLVRSEVTSDNPDPKLQNNVAAFVFVPQSVNMANFDRLVYIESPSTAAIQDTVVVPVTVVNVDYGTAPASTLEIQTTAQPSADGCTLEMGLLQCPIPALAVGEKHVVLVSLVFPFVGSHQLFARTVSDPRDSRNYNNFDARSIFINNGATAAHDMSLELTNTPPRDVFVGDSISFVFTVSNTGQLATRVLDFGVSSEFEITAINGFNCQFSTFSCLITLEPNETSSITVETKAIAVTGSHGSSPISVGLSYSEDDTNQGNDQAYLSSYTVAYNPATSANLETSIQANPEPPSNAIGTQYLVTITNTGAVTAENLSVSSTYFGTATVIRSAACTEVCALPNLEPNQSVSLTITTTSLETDQYVQVSALAATTTANTNPNAAYPAYYFAQVNP